MTIIAEHGAGFAAAKSHEKEMYRDFVGQLESKWKRSNELVYIIGFVRVAGVEFDCILLKQNCICVIDFKAYTGPIALRTLHGENITTFSDNAIWYALGSRQEVKGGAQSTPFMQTEKNKWGLTNHLKVLNEEIPLIELRNFANVSGMVILKHKGDFPYEIPSNRRDGAHKWFYVADINSAINHIGRIEQNSAIRLSNDHIRAIARKILYNDESLWKNCAPNLNIESTGSHALKDIPSQNRLRKDSVHSRGYSKTSRPQVSHKQPELSANSIPNKKRDNIVDEPDSGRRKHYKIPFYKNPWYVAISIVLVVLGFFIFENYGPVKQNISRFAQVDGNAPKERKDQIAIDSRRLGGSSSKVVITTSTDRAAIVSGPFLISTPSADSDNDGTYDTYVPSDIVQVSVGFTEQLCGLGSLELKLQTGNGTVTKRRAQYCGCSPDFVFFCYQVVPGDRDLDGISIGANAVSFRTYDGDTPSVVHGPVPAQFLHRVDGNLPDTSRPRLASAPSISNTPGDGKTYRRDDAIMIEFPLTEEVEVSTKGGSITLSLEIGNTIRYARYVGSVIDSKGRHSLMFAYVVRREDRDFDGTIWVPADGMVVPVGSSIKDLSGNNAVLSWTVSAGRSLRVDGR